ncbi:hypothetical protein [Vibrio sonorensis]|nr:hypothetical protein [Vibrio sonorensis]
MSHSPSQPLGGKLFTPKVILFIAIIAISIGVITYRMFYGIGSVSA